MTFRVGMKVVCVDAKGGFRDLLGDVFDTNEITEGAVYTIRWLGIQNDEAVCRLEEVVRGYQVPNGKRAANLGEDVPWACDRFRPLVERKTDISILTALLVPGAKISEDA